MCNHADALMYPSVVLFHRDLDGFAAAWSVVVALQRDGVDAPELVGVQYGEPVPFDAISCRDVAIVDFCYDYVTLLRIREIAAQVVVLDHHKRSQEICALPFVHVDRSKAGCRLAWEHWHPGEPVPSLVRFVEDRDLWRFVLPGTREFCAALGNGDWTIERFTEYAERPFEAVVAEGRPLVEYVDRMAERVANRAHKAFLYGDGLPLTECLATCVPLSIGIHSEICHAMLCREDSPGIAVAWRWLGDGTFSVSLRSPDDGVDVSELARLFSGGGHEHAAGFGHPGPISSFLSLASDTEQL